MYAKKVAFSFFTVPALGKNHSILTLAIVLAHQGYEFQTRRKAEKENDIDEGIKTYVLQYKPDILAMFPAERGFFDKIFQSSHTEEIAFHATVPLLVIH